MSVLSLSLFVLLSLIGPGYPVQPVSAPAPLSWERVFSLAGAPALVHAQVHYLDSGGGSHSLELLRQGDRRVVRKTDGALELLAERNARGEVDYALADLRRARLIQVNRTSLHRIGVMSDFGSLAALVARPATAHVLTASLRPVEKSTLGTCRWLHVDVTAPAGQPAREICWSDRWKLPLHIEVARGEQWTRVLEVDSVDARVDVRALRANPAAFTVIHADDDIDPSQDM
jgi:hypothetical protein